VGGGSSIITDPTRSAAERAGAGVKEEKRTMMTVLNGQFFARVFHADSSARLPDGRELSYGWKGKSRRRGPSGGGAARKMKTSSPGSDSAKRMPRIILPALFFRN
jgi:hypothetical protein